MVTREDIKKLVYEIISRNSDVPMSDELLNESFVDYFGEDSLDIVEQCMELENEYNIVLDYDDVKKCITPSNLIDVVFEKIKGN